VHHAGKATTAVFRLDRLPGLLGDGRTCLQRLHPVRPRHRPRAIPPGGISFTPAAKLESLPILKADGAPKISFDQTLSQMDRLAPILSDLQDKLDRSQFDLDALGASLGL